MRFYTSFAAADAEFAAAFNNVLRQHKHRVDYTPRMGDACGANWMQRIHDAERVLLIISAAALNDGLCKVEREYALAKAVPLTIIHRDGLLPTGLAGQPIIEAHQPIEAGQSLLMMMQATTTTPE